MGWCCGFNGLYRENLNRDRLYGIYLIVEPDSRGCGLGSLLFDDLMIHSAGLDARTLRIRVRDNCEPGHQVCNPPRFYAKKAQRRDDV